MRGIYKQEKLLPSCQALAQEYDVSLITMRRTLELLNDIRVTETINGVGTRVISGRLAGPPDLSHLQIRKCLLMLLQAMQISALTCENVAVHTLSSLDEEDFQVFGREIGRLIKEGTPFLTAKAAFALLVITAPRLLSGRCTVNYIFYCSGARPACFPKNWIPAGFTSSMQKICAGHLAAGISKALQENCQN